MGRWAGAALAFLVAGFQLYEWLKCRRSPARRNATARHGWLGVAFLPSTVAGRRGLLDASIVSSGGLLLVGAGTALNQVSVGSPAADVAGSMMRLGLVLFGFGWPLCAFLGQPKLLRPWYARDEPAPWRGARREARLTDHDRDLESGSRVAEQERRLRARRDRLRTSQPKS